MKYLVFFPLFFFFQAQAQTDSTDQHKVHCDCNHTVEFLSGKTKVESREPCTNLVQGLNTVHSNEIEGAAGLKCNDEGCTCFFSHSVFGFGADRDSAIRNAESTCQQVSSQTGKTFNITPAECKNE